MDNTLPTSIASIEQVQELEAILKIKNPKLDKHRLLWTLIGTMSVGISKEAMEKIISLAKR